MQIRLVPGGHWHRRHGSKESETACGELVPGAYGTRDDVIDDQICPRCFTPDEQDTGQMKKLEVELERQSDPALFFDPEEEPTDPNGGDHG